jgi:uncharacterized membrane protein YdbT with pleckstrin-like domain
MISKNSGPNQHIGEDVVFHLRRHWFIFFRMFLFFSLLVALPAVVYFIITSGTTNMLENEISYPMLVVLFLSYYLMLLISIFTVWTNTYLDVWTVTTDRIINREQNGLFHRVVSELDLRRVQDVTAEQKGFFPTIFHYGNVYVQSAGVKERFVFEQIPHPYRVAKMIQKLDEKAKKNRLK